MARRKIFIFAKKLILVLLLIVVFNFALSEKEQNHAIDGFSLDLILQNVFKKSLKYFSVLAVNPNIIEGIPFDFDVIAPSMPYAPNYPQRLIKISYDIAEISKGLIGLNQDVFDYVDGCDCRFARSFCQVIGPGELGCKKIGVFGEICPEPIPLDVADPDTEIDGIEERNTIDSSIIRLTLLREVFKKELESEELAKELATLREEDKNALLQEIDDLLGLAEEIKDRSAANKNLAENCFSEGIQACSTQCASQMDLRICPAVTMRQHKPIELEINVGVGLDDLSPGSVGIDTANINLPEKISLPELPDIELSGFTIHMPQIILECPIEKQSFALRTPSPVLTPSQTIELSCPTYQNYQNPQCIMPGSGEEGSIEAEMNWFLKTFSWLSEKCLELPEMKDPEFVQNIIKQIEEILAPYDVIYNWPNPPVYPPPMNFNPPPAHIQAIINSLLEMLYNAPPSQKAEKCFDIENVHTTIIQECNNYWLTSPVVYHTPYICIDLGPPPSEPAKRRECRNVFTTAEDPIPQTCNTAPVPTLKNKCEDLKASFEEPPSPCNFLPLFTGEFPVPEGLEQEIPGIECPKGTIGSYPKTAMPGCTIAIPSIPKISFPKVIIPDIRLPSINLPPFFYVKLPSLIFEDLEIPDIDLCDLHECQFAFPNLRIKVPSLKIPEINAFASFDVPGGANVDIEMPTLRFPSLSFDFPQIGLNLGNLVVPEIKTPDFSLPRPKLKFSLSGFNIDLAGLIWGLIPLPSPITTCLETSLPWFSGIHIVFPDYYFSWPEFPRVPEIPFCEDAREFCGKVNSSIKDVSLKTIEIENVINNEFQNIQDKLDDFALRIQDAIQLQIQGELDEIAEDMKRRMQEHIAAHVFPEPYPAGDVPFPGIWPIGKNLPCDQIPPLVIPAKEIKVSSKKLSDYFPNSDDIPREITVPWPESLKKVLLSNPLLYELRTIPLSRLSYEKTIPINLPGLKHGSPPNLDFLKSITFLGCKSQPPSGGNPCNTGEINANLNRINELEQGINQSFQKIERILF